MFKFIKEWLKQREQKLLLKQQERALKAERKRKNLQQAYYRKCVYGLIADHEIFDEMPTYPHDKLPNKYTIKKWLFGDLKIVRVRYIRGDVIEVSLKGKEIAAWVDQDHPYGIGINDFKCTEDFSIVVVYRQKYLKVYKV